MAKLGFFQRARAAVNLMMRSASHPADLAGMIELLLRSHESVSGATVNPHTAMRVAAVYACIGVISETLGALPIMVYKRTATGREKVPDHPLMRLFKAPNPWQNRMEFIEMMAMHVCLRGNAYCFMNVVDIAAGKKAVQELIPLHPDCVRVEVGPDKMPRYFYRPMEGGKWSPEVQIPWENILHIRYKSLDGYTGLSPISVARDVIGMGITLQDHAGMMFKRGAHTGGVLEHPETLTDEVATRIRNSWQETYGGAQNAGKVIVLEEGMVYKAVGMSMQDAQYIDTRKMNRVEIASIFRVPPHKIGALDKVSYNSMEQQALEFYMDTMLAWCTRFELAFLRDLVRADDTYYVKFNLGTILRGDIKARYEAYKIGREAGFLCPNDIREMEDMNPIPDGDVYLQPSNFVPLGTEPEPVPAPGADPNKPPAEDEEEDKSNPMLALVKRFRKGLTE